MKKWSWERTDLNSFNPKSGNYDAPSASAWFISPDGKKHEIMNVSDEYMDNLVTSMNYVVISKIRAAAELIL